MAFILMQDYPKRPAAEQESLIWLAAIYRKSSFEIQRYIASKVGTVALPEDLTSTVFLKAIR